MKVLDVGCGASDNLDAVRLDINPLTGADVIHDLGVFPYPFEDNEFDKVIASHIVEHVPDVMGFINELYRISRPGARILIKTPHYTNPDWANDPTHRNHINSYTFNTFVPDRRLHEFYTSANLRPVSIHVSLLNLWRAMGLEFLVNLDGRWPAMRFTRKFWEQYLSSVCRGKELNFEFEVIKDAVPAKS